LLPVFAIPSSFLAPLYGHGLQIRAIGFSKNCASNFFWSVGKGVAIEM